MANSPSERNAFPVVFSDDSGEGGMTLQEWYFGMAMQGLLAGRHIGNDTEKTIHDTMEVLTDRAWQISCAMIERAV